MFTLKPLSIIAGSIVAIHGLGAHPIGDWQKGQYVWIRDSLPSDFPKARIMTFEYMVRISRDTGFSTIRNVAVELLEDLAKERQNVCALISDCTV